MAPQTLFLILPIAIVALSILITKYLSSVRSKTHKKLCHPPGPLGIPVIGFLYHMMIGGKTYQRKLLEIKQKYGKVATVRMGSFSCIWLNDYKTVKEAFANPIFCGRPKIDGITSRTLGFVGGLIFNDGPDFKEQRRFVVKHLKDLGLGRKMSMESVILEEITELIKSLEKKSGKAITTRHLFNVAVMNSLWRIITGEKFDHDDPTLIQLNETLNRNMELSGLAKIAFFVPWIKSIFPSSIGWDAYFKDATSIFNFWRDYSKSKVKQYKAEVMPNYFIDFYIKGIRECRNPNSGFYKERGEISLATTIQDLFVAGTETTSTTLTWALLYLASFQNIQQKFAHEVNRVIGQCRLPDINDRLRMPYAEAFLQELMRYGTLAPLGIVHRTTEDTELCGYFIPKDSIVQANVSAIHNDPEYWENPEEFLPERFLDKNEENLIKKESFLPFSYGGRHCIGEMFAREELFLFLTAIVQKFHIDVDPSYPRPSLIPIVGVGSIPQRHKLVLLLRDSSNPINS